jgi:hypothetical protein
MDHPGGVNFGVHSRKLNTSILTGHLVAVFESISYMKQCLLKNIFKIKLLFQFTLTKALMPGLKLV